MIIPSSRPVPSRAIAVTAMLGSAVCWGGATVMTKGALEAFDPFILLVIQLTFSVTALWTAVILSSSPMLGLRPMARAGSTGVLEPGLAYAVGVPGLAMTTAGNASVIAALEPVFIFLGAWVLFRTRPCAVAFAAIVVAVIGVTLVSLTDPAALGAARFLVTGWFCWAPRSPLLMFLRQAGLP